MLNNSMGRLLPRSKQDSTEANLAAVATVSFQRGQDHWSYQQDRGLIHPRRDPAWHQEIKHPGLGRTAMARSTKVLEDAEAVLCWMQWWCSGARSYTDVGGGALGSGGRGCTKTTRRCSGHRTATSTLALACAGQSFGSSVRELGSSAHLTSCTKRLTIRSTKFIFAQV
jgi:hypothetical protein